MLDGTDRPRLVEGLRLERRIGRGGEGEVWQVRDPQGRRRALKLVRPEALAAPEAVEERAAYLRRIDHPALVRVHRSGLLHGGPLDGWGFVEMDLVEGESLAAAPGDWALLDGLLPLAKALDLLHAGHWSDGRPLVHRDVKPANIVATSDGRLVLVDPSTLRGVDSATVTRIGTPVFAAPEVITGRMGPPADVYSFAVTALALLTGARGGELAELVDRVDQLDVPGGVRAGLAPDPGHRPVSCVALLTDDEPVRVADAGLVEEWDQTWPSGEQRLDPPVDVRRRVWPWLALLVLLVAGPLSGWAAGVLERQELLAAGVLAAGVHLLAHALDRRSVLLALAAPPVAWAFLLGDRLAEGRRRAWGRALMTGALVTVMGPPVAVLAGAAADPAVALVSLPGLGLVFAAVGAVRATGAGGVLLRLLLLPLWAVGAVVLVGAGLVALPGAVLVGRTRAVVRFIGSTLVGAVENLRGPPRGRMMAIPELGARP